MKKNTLTLILFLCGLGMGIAQNPISKKSTANVPELQTSTLKSLSIPTSLASWKSKKAIEQKGLKSYSVYSEKLEGNIKIQLDKNGQISGIYVPEDWDIPVDFLLQNLNASELRAMKGCDKLECFIEKLKTLFENHQL